MSPESIGNLSMLNANRASTTNTANSADNSQRDMFMTLLVAQLKNQDPLQPQDGAEFVAQLTQFNSLDQLVGIRQTLEQLVTAQQTQNAETNTARK